MTFVSDFQGLQDDILSIRDQLGAQKHFVKILKRKGSVADSELDDFNDIDPVDTIEHEILPSPRIVDYSHDLRMKEGGKIRQGDLIVKMISKNAFPDRSTIDGTSTDPSETFYYLVNNELYTIINVAEDYTWWNAHIRKANNQTLYLA